MSDFILNDYDTSKSFFVYVDLTDESIPFYAGKGNLSRLRGRSRNNKHSGIAKKYGLKRLVILSTNVEQEAFDKEIELIADIQLNAYKYPENHFACNFTDGGEGGSGWKLSEETRLRIRQSHHDVKGKNNPMWGKPNRYKGIARSEHTRLKIAASHKEKPKSAEHKRKLSDAVRDAWKRGVLCSTGRRPNQTGDKNPMSHANIARRRFKACFDSPGFKFVIERMLIAIENHS